MSKSTGAVHKIALTAGEPAGIGPELLLRLAARPWPAELVAIADRELLAQRAAALNLAIEFQDYQPEAPARAAVAGRLSVLHQPLAQTSEAGKLNPGNAEAILQTLARACDGCLRGEFAAMVTGPVHKGVINDAGISFSGHTEFLAERCGAARVVMLLVAGELRVALVTTHLALRQVPDAITHARVVDTAGILNAGLIEGLGIENPRILILGLNPHAGESGHLGTEEQQVIEPACKHLRAQGMDVVGPLPADTAFTPSQLAAADAVLAMYHDQGLTVLKHRGFGHAVNITLGLPIVRTSVDHGTALDLAGTGRADAGSFIAALELALQVSCNTAT